MTKSVNKQNEELARMRRNVERRAADPSDESVHYPLGHAAYCGKDNGTRDAWINDDDLVSCPRCRQRAARLATVIVPPNDKRATSLNEAKAHAAGQELTRLNVNALRGARVAAADAYSGDAELAEAALTGFDAAVNALCDAIEAANPTFDRAVLWKAVLA